MHCYMMMVILRRLPAAMHAVRFYTVYTSGAPVRLRLLVCGVMLAWTLDEPVACGPACLLPCSVRSSRVQEAGHLRPMVRAGATHVSASKRFSLKKNAGFYRDRLGQFSKMLGK
jgi:hypothetical protein|eukprot:COSAG06_NODE_1780_length_8407_cov_3.654230_10_plen_114_part_00